MKEYCTLLLVKIEADSAKEAIDKVGKIGKLLRIAVDEEYCMEGL